jgi:hypothetical protein
MPTITPSLVYIDGQKLDVEKHNENVYSTGLSEGIMSTANGGLDASNLHSTFKVESEHLQIEETAVARQDGRNTTVDCFQSAFARAPTDTTTSMNSVLTKESFFAPIPGASIRFYQPYDASFAHLSWSMFINPFTVRKYSGNPASASSITTTAEPMTGLAMRFDGEIIDHTRRNITITAWAETSVRNAVDDGEAKCGQWWDMTHLVTGLSAGYHDLQLGLYMEILDAEMSYGVSRAWAASTTYSSKLFQRVSFGVTNAKVVTFL